MNVLLAGDSVRRLNRLHRETRTSREKKSDGNDEKRLPARRTS
jgi:hypothetical protein